MGDLEHGLSFSLWFRSGTDADLLVRDFPGLCIWVGLSPDRSFKHNCQEPSEVLKLQRIPSFKAKGSFNGRLELNSELYASQSVIMLVASFFISYFKLFFFENPPLAQDQHRRQERNMLVFIRFWYPKLNQHSRNLWHLWLRKRKIGRGMIKLIRVKETNTDEIVYTRNTRAG